MLSTGLHFASESTGGRSARSNINIPVFLILSKYLSIICSIFPFNRALLTHYFFDAPTILLSSIATVNTFSICRAPVNVR